MRFSIELDREEDGRWIADVPDLPGVMAYGSTQSEAVRKVTALGMRVVAERIELGKAEPTDVVQFIAAA